MDRISELEKQLEQEREKVKGLHEITKVICTHCCEPMEIPSKAVLQTQLTQLQAAGNAMMKALRAMRDNKESWYTTVTPELMNAWDMMKTSLGPATLDATTPASNHFGGINNMVSKGGDGE